MKGVFIAKTLQIYLKMKAGETKNKSRRLLIVSLALHIRVVTSNQLLK